MENFVMMMNIMEVKMIRPLIADDVHRYVICINIIDLLIEGEAQLYIENITIAEHFHLTPIITLPSYYPNEIIRDNEDLRTKIIEELKKLIRPKQTYAYGEKMPPKYYNFKIEGIKVVRY